MTLKLGSCDSVPIRLSVKPSLRYSLFGSPVALTKGRTAMELTVRFSDAWRTKYTPTAAATASSTTPAPMATFVRERTGTTTGGAEAAAAELELTLLTPEALDECPKSKSRFRRARSVRRSAAL